MRICIVTTGQPATNPRVVKEADALSEAGHRVVVVCCRFVEWATRFDAELLAGKPWQARWVVWSRREAPWLHVGSRTRHYLARRLWRFGARGASLLAAAAHRVTPELAAAAESVDADLYIGHYLPGLAAARRAAARRGAPVGFDAEDYHRGQLPPAADPAERLLVETQEERWLPRCAYLTGASEGITAAYRERFASLPLFATVHNSFPLHPRATELQRSRDADRRPGELAVFWFSQTVALERGIETAMRALARLPAGASLTLMGRCEPSTRARIEQVAGALGVGGRVTLRRPASPLSLIEVAASHDVGLAAEDPEQCRNSDLCLSNKLFTYLGAGLAVAASRTRGQRRVFQKTPLVGFEFDAGDWQGLARGIGRLAADPAALAAARSASLEAACGPWSWEQDRERLLATVEAACAGR